MNDELKDIYSIYDWYEKRLKLINDSNRAGFVHDDARLTNPIKINISPETLKKLPKLGGK